MALDEQINSESGEEVKQKRSRSPNSLQRYKLEKLFNNIDKPVHIAPLPKKRTFPEPPAFVRHVMGSSAGAGSGEFHVYNQIRKREYARMKFFEYEAIKEEKDVEFKRKVEENERIEEEKTARKRAKRQKKKQKLLERKGVTSSKLDNSNTTLSSNSADKDQSNTS